MEVEVRILGSEKGNTVFYKDNRPRDAESILNQAMHFDSEISRYNKQINGVWHSSPHRKLKYHELMKKREEGLWEKNLCNMMTSYFNIL